MLAKDQVARFSDGLIGLVMSCTCVKTNFSFVIVTLKNSAIITIILAHSCICAMAPRASAYKYQEKNLAERKPGLPCLVADHVDSSPFALAVARARGRLAVINRHDFARRQRGHFLAPRR